ncbi:response regulator [Oceanobacter mangrovi]|uniref:response regulator n=1 Tax=Oceanobacter mangrovi TaxID=2862510 RepID=UPI001C8D9F28|nr:response regulator [Oceanobacter mangrovi]
MPTVGDDYTKLKRRVLWRTLGSVFLLLALLAITLKAFYNEEKKRLESSQDVAARHLLSQSREAVQYSLRSIQEDVRYLMGVHQRVGRSMVSEATHFTLLEGAYQAFLSSHLDQYQQLRFLSPYGQEVLRVEQFDDGSVRQVAANLLQDRSRSDYFRAVMGVPPGHLILTEMKPIRDLATLQQMRFEPLLQLAGRPNRLAAGNDGVLVLTYRIGSMLDYLQQQSSHLEGSFWLVDQYGNWLMPPRQTGIWHLQGDQNHPHSVPLDFPAVWQRLQGGDVTSDSEGLLLTDRLAVSRFLNNKPVSMITDPAEQALFDKGQHWQLVYWLPESQRWNSLAKLRNWLLLGFLLMASLILVRAGVGYRQTIERLQAFVSLERANAEFRELLSATPDGILVADKQGHIVMVNHQMEDLFGYERGELIGQPVELLIPMKFRREHPQLRESYNAKPMRRAMGEGRPLSAVAKNGGEFPVSVSLNAVDSPDGYQVICGVRDLTAELASRERISQLNRELLESNQQLEQRVAERTSELEEARHQAEYLTQVKSEFLANMSHEIRTPLNAILGLAYLLDNSKLQRDSADMVKKICKAGRSLQMIINDILDFSKLEVGRLEIEQAPFRLDSLTDNLATIMSSNLGSKNIELVISPPPAVANFLIGDSLRLEQVLINLAGNAIKFTESGTVLVSIELVAQQQQQVELRFSVRDTGIGISAAKAEEIFAPFSQADSSTTRKFGGTGLGLSISRQLVQIMGGELQLDSVLGEGSEFFFTLTFPRAREQIFSHPELSGLKLMIADDNPIALDALKNVVDTLGWEARTFVSAEELINALDNRLRGETIPPVILLDWEMDGMDGLQAARAIRQRYSDEEAPILVMVTSYGRDKLAASDNLDCLDGFINKPVTGSELFDHVLRIRHLRHQQGHVDTELPCQRLAGLHLLVTDDSEINREVAARIFGGEGARISLAANGREAVELLQSQPDDTFDLVLMDAQMPIMDGYEATRIIRQSAGILHLPVIALTAGAFQDQRERAEAAGMNGFIPKPFDVDAAVALILRNVSPEPIRQHAAGQPFEDSSQTGVANETDLPLFNPGKAMQTWQDLSVYRRYLGIFRRDYGDQPEEEARAWLHKMRGAAANLGLERVAAEAAIVEQQTDRGEEPDPQALSKVLDRLQQTFTLVDEYLADAAYTATMPVTAVDERSLLVVLEHLLEALAADDIDQSEQLAADLAAKCPDNRCQQLLDALAAFNLTEAAGLARQMKTDFAKRSKL